MNAFEAGSRKAIPAVLIYLRGGGRVLMLHRNAPDRPGDYHAGKWNGLGGKLEPDESFREAARRETREEAGIELPLEAFQPIGTLQFPNFKAHKHEDWIVAVFTAEVPGPGPGAKPAPSSEGTLHWVAEAELLELNLWPGDRHFLPLVLAKQPFLGTIWYHGQEVMRHEVIPLR